MVKKILHLALALSIALSISGAIAAETAVDESKYALISPNATAETKQLYFALTQMQGKATLFGHHFSNVFGREFTDWKQSQNRCDVVESVGDYPAVFGFDFGRGFDNQLPAVKAAAKKGGVITFSDHVRNPFTPQTYNHSKEHAMSEIKAVLPEGEHHDYLLAHLDKIADFASKAVVDGKKIPIIYRPWHEHTGRWFWWGCESGSEEEYIALWRFSVEYLRDTKGVDNFIYAYSPSFDDVDNLYETRNPGANYFDIVGIDIYTIDKYDQVERLGKAISAIVDYASGHDKIAALTEFGYRGGIQNCSDPNWYTETLLKALLSSDKGCNVVYALTWSNTKSGGWIPLKGDLTHKDFKLLHKNPRIAFLKEWLNR